MAQNGTEIRQASAQPRAAGAKVRFEVLDSWRGICAILVAMMHFPAVGWLADNAVVRGGYLFVDYFFVLSGAVIAHGYGAKIADRESYNRFMMLRLGRVYPLHVAVLLLFIAFETMRLVAPALHGDGAPPFSDGNGLSGIISSLFLLNGTGQETQLVWNGPSWSISSEFWTYALFGAAITILRGRAWMALAAAVVICPIVLARESYSFMDTTYALGLVRCIYGFSLGALLYWVMQPRLQARDAAAREDGRVWTAVELLTVAGVVAFVGLAAHNAASFAAPLVFGAAMAVFMQERGAVSRVLRGRVFLWLGTLSYGIYMLHIFVQSRLINVGTLAGKITGRDFIGQFEMAGQSFIGFGVNGPLFGTLMMVLMLAAVVVAAWIGNIVIEKPFQKLTRAWLDSADARRIEKSRRYAQAAFHASRTAIGAGPR